MIFLTFILEILPYIRVGGTFENSVLVINDDILPEYQMARHQTRPFEITWVCIKHELFSMIIDRVYRYLRIGIPGGRRGALARRGVSP